VRVCECASVHVCITIINYVRKTIIVQATGLKFASKDSAYPSMMS